MIAAGARYFAIVFSIAFLLGTVRTVWLAPAIGATAAVLVELPLILAVSFLAARHIIARRRIVTPGAALGAGAFAFALLMITEAGLAVLLFGQSLTMWLAALWKVPGVIGLAGQTAFALMPWLVVMRRGRKENRLP